MSQKRDAWFAFDVGDYLRDTPLFTTEQHGAYLLLILAYWPNGPLPDDDSALASATKLSVPTWRRMRATLQAKFTVKDGLWHHKRVDKERMKAFAISELRRVAGEAGASKRHGKPVAIATVRQPQLPTHLQRNNNKTLSSIQSGSEGARVEDARPQHPDERPMTEAGQAAELLVKKLLEKVATS